MTSAEQAENARRLLSKWDEMEKWAVWLEGGRRCAVKQTPYIDGWWVGVSPRNGEGATVEGPWEDWVALARAILEHDEKIKRGEATENIPAAEGQERSGSE